MSQAVPRPPRRSPERRDRRRGRVTPPAPVADLEQKRQQRQQVQTPQRRPATKPRRRARRPLVPFVLGLALGYGLAGPLPQLLNSPDTLAQMVQPLSFGERRIVVLGTDQVGDNTDVMLTVRIRDGRTEITQVPRDTLVESEQFGVVKANALYAFGGMRTVKQELSTLLDAPVERYLRVNLRAVERLAAALGGVQVEVPKRMLYVDNAQGLSIDLQPGLQLLNGKDLEGFLRFRHDELGDLGRMERQKQVLAEVFRKLTDPGTLVRLPILLQVAGDDIQTDLNPIELGQLLTAMTRTELKTEQLPGREFWYNDLSYWMPVNNRHFAGMDSEEPAL